MSTHIVIKKVDPESVEVPPGYLYEVECPGRPDCDGQVECDESHVVDGRDADDEGPDDCSPDAPWEGMDEFEFHGAVHRWLWCGWTVPYDGCAVREHPYFADVVADQLVGLPPGRYPVRDFWDEDLMELRLVEEVQS